MITIVTGSEKLLEEYLKCLCKILYKLEKELGNNFIGLEQVIITPFINRTDSGAFYHYNGNINKGYLFIDNNRFNLDSIKKLNSIQISYFEHTIIHEIGHHLYRTHNLKDKVSKFYNDNDNKKYIEEFRKNNTYQYKDELSEFFAYYFCKFYYVDNKIFHFILDEYILLIKGER